MNNQFTQPHKVVTVETNKQAIARDFGIKSNQVAYLDQKTEVSSYLVLYEKASQTSWFTRAATGIPVSWYIEDGVLNLMTSAGTFRLNQAINVSTIDLADGAKGDNLVGSKLDIPGAVLVTQRMLNSQYVTFEQFGAKGDGVTDDTAAIQAAINSGLRTIRSSVFPHKKFYRINGTLTIKDQIELDFNRSEIIQTGNFSHFNISNGTTQVNAPVIVGATMTNDVVTSVAQIVAKNVGNMVLRNVAAYGASKSYGLVRLENTIVTHLIDCTTTNCVGKDIELVGLGSGGLKTFDTTITGGRFERGVRGLSIGDNVEGVFVRSAIFYDYSIIQLEIGASATAKAISMMFSSVNFDSPNNLNFLFLDNYQALQFNSCWFSGQAAKSIIQTGSGGDTLLITGAQAYIVDAFLVDGAIGTMLTASTINGGTIPVQFTNTANFTKISENTFRSCSSHCVLVDNHMGILQVSNNLMASSNAASGIGGTEKVGMSFEGNKGDPGRGVTNSTYVGNTSPRTWTVGARPENLAFRKGSGITSISVNNVEVYNSNDAGTPSSYINLGTLPTGTVVTATFSTTNAPWLNRVKL